MSALPRGEVNYADKFAELVKMDTDAQMEFFLKSFIFGLGDNWKEVPRLATLFKDYLIEQSEKNDLDPVQASEFLQRMGRTRTAIERRRELADIDLDSNDRICFTEYLLLHYKVMILTEYFKRKDMQPTVSLENDGVGLLDVGEMLLEELFTLPLGLSPEIEAAIEEFMAKKKERESKIAELKEKMKAGGVKGLTAKTELVALENSDMTEFNRVEITLAAAKRRSAKESGAVALEKKQLKEKEEKAAAALASRQKLAARAAMFEGK